MAERLWRFTSAGARFPADLWTTNLFTAVLIAVMLATVLTSFRPTSQHEKAQ
jgi:hypothetical protein